MAVMAAGVIDVIIVFTAGANTETITAPNTSSAIARIAVTMTLSSPVSERELLSILPPKTDLRRRRRLPT